MKYHGFPRTNPLRAALVLLTGWLLTENAFSITDPSLQVQFVRIGQNVVVSWSGANAVPYQVQASSDLTSWTNISPVLTGTGLQLSFTNSLVGQGGQFFRVNRLFPAAPGSATFDPTTGLLTVVGDALHTFINVANDGTGSGVLVVNGGAIPITGGTPTTANTVLIQILGSPGDDQLMVSPGLPPAHIFGAEGNDTLYGGSGNDMLVGGPGRDILAGRQGSDILYADGDDTVIWNPGDSSDLIQGSGTNNTLVFNCANINERIELFANGPRLRLTRDVANITIDADGIQTVNINALGGTDNIMVDSLVGTAVALVNVDLASVVGTTNGDATADTVTIVGTSGADTFNVAANGSAVEVTGLGALVHVVNAELANDRIAITGVGGDLVNVNGTDGPDTMQIVLSPLTNFARVYVSGYTIPVDVNGALTLRVNGLGGPDTITGGNAIAALNIPIILDGGDGDDMIIGTDAADTIYGGAGTNTIIGGRGNDILYPSGNDTVSWNPGDGSDTIQGSGTNNTLVFNASNVSEKIELSANGPRLRLTRDVASIVLDADGIQTVNINALGGSDNVIVDNLVGTAVALVNVDLASVVGTTNGDGAADTVTIAGTSGADTFNVAANGNAVEVTGLGALVRVINAELANDRIAITGVGGDLVNVNGTDGPDTMQIVLAPLTNYARVYVSGYTIPVDVNGALTLRVNGLGGPDTITGGNAIAALNIPIILDGGDGDDMIIGTDAADTIYGGAGTNTIIGGRGNDILYPSGNDTISWNPGDGSDVIQGSGTNNTLVFNAANINERIELSANGPRLRLTRDVASITLDADGVQTVNIRALGGIDNVIVNSLVGTAVSQVNVDLAGSGGTGDGAADTVTIYGTAAPDTFNITTNAGVVTVSGTIPQVQISHPEVANDTLVINGLDGTDVFNVGPGVISLIGLILNQ
jgi:Ca2+-binding RTX toxin-like protein